MRAEPVHVHERPRRAVREPRLRLVEPRPVVELRQPTVSLAPANMRALQRTSGNRAVGALLRRHPLDPTRAVPTTADAVRATIVMDDPIGVMPLVSFTLGKDVQVVVPSTTLDSDLMRLMVQGVEMKLVTISTASFGLELDDVLITSFSKSGLADEAVVQLTLSFTSQHLK